MRYRFNKKKDSWGHTQDNKGKWKKKVSKSQTIPGLAYDLGDLVRKFQAGGVVSNQLLREGEYHQHGSIPPEGHADYIDLVDAAAVAQAAHEAQVKLKEQEVAKKKAKAAEDFSAAVSKAVEEKLKERDNDLNDDAK